MIVETVSLRHAEEFIFAHLVRFRRLIDILQCSRSIVTRENLIKGFRSQGWKTRQQIHPLAPRRESFDLLGDRVAIEIEFSRYEFIYRDYFRFLSAYNADKIDVGVLIINADPKAGRVKHPAVAPSLARIKDDLAWLRPTLTVPLWIVALK